MKWRAMFTACLQTCWLCRRTAGGPGVGLLMAFMCDSTRRSNDFITITVDVRAMGLLSLSPVVLVFFGTGIMVEVLK